MRKTLRTGLAALFALAVGGIAIARNRFDRTVRKEVDRLPDATVDSRRYREGDLEGLPAPVQRYLDNVLVDGVAYAQRVTVHQSGTFRLAPDESAPWKPLTATQHFRTDPPGFVYDASIDVLPGVPVRVVDTYLDGEGSLTGKLLSTVAVTRARPGPALDEGELLRYLGEAVWFPTALVDVDWEAIDDDSARATIESGGETASLVFQFEDGEVHSVHTEGRYRQETDDYAPWTGRFSDYQWRNGRRIPLAAEAEWDGPGDGRYWRAEITDIEHEPTTGPRPTGVPE